MNKKNSTKEEKVISKILEHHALLRQKYLPAVRFLKKEIKFKYARVGDQSIEYFRMDELESLKQPEIQKLKKLLQSESPIEDIKKDIKYLARLPNSPKYTYPQVLQPSENITKFAYFQFNSEQSRRGLMLAILLGILAVVLFPVWPYELKYATWLISYYFLIFILVIIVVRLVFYSLMALLGFSFWIFPNFLNQTNFLKSFKPVYSIERWQRSILTVIIRVSILALFVYYAAQFYKDPTIIEENIEITKGALNDIHDWGVKKIKGEKQFAQRAIASIEDIINKTQTDAPKTETSTESQQTTEQPGQPNEQASEYKREQEIKVEVEGTQWSGL